MRKLIATVMAVVLLFTLAACGGSEAAAGERSIGDTAQNVPTGVEDGILTIAMEGAYAPYNWAQNDDSNGAVQIKNVPGSYVNGYDVMIAKTIAEANDWELKIIQSDWDSLVPAVMTGSIDAAIAGQSMTASRSKQVDFAGPYFYATMVVLTKADSSYADAEGILDFGGAAGTAQLATIWYEECLPQMEGADIKSASADAPAMLMALETGTVDFVVTDLPTAQGAVIAYPGMKILDFSGTEGDFSFSEQERAENVNIGISVMKGNAYLRDAINDILDTMSVEDFNSLMEEAISIQPLSED
ncbi:MAG: transporter substrate-binding domain-containing protein [Eubacteriales bacterium]|nr:transporter substrate-binding domain-containing protein [Eubacteriales bacterium]